MGRSCPSDSTRSSCSPSSIKTPPAPTQEPSVECLFWPPQRIENLTSCQAQGGVCRGERVGNGHACNSPGKSSSELLAKGTANGSPAPLPADRLRDACRHSLRTARAWVCKSLSSRETDLRDASWAAAGASTRHQSLTQGLGS